MNKTATRTGLLSALFLLSLLVVACGEGTTKQGTLYSVGMNNTLSCYISAPIAAVHKSSLSSVKAAGYTVDTEAIDSREAKVEGHTALDKLVKITSYKQGDKVTKIEVNVAGNEAAAKDLLDAIEKGAG